MWLSHAPQAYGFESGRWQASMLRKMILDRLDMDIKPRTLRATLHRMRLSFRMFREVPHKSADPETRKKFIEDTQKRMDALGQGGVHQLLRGRDDHAAGRPEGPELAAARRTRGR